jgi:tetratricopeptide (TPR) repeat protein
MATNAEKQNRTGRKPRLVPALAALGVIAAAGGGVYLRARTSGPATPALSPAEMHYRDGLRLAQDGKEAGAIRAWQTAIALAPADPRPYRALVALYEQEGQFIRAAEQLTALRAANPQAEHIACRQADLYFHANRYLTGMRLAREAVQQEPQCPLAHSALGVGLAMAGETLQALRELRAAQVLAPDSERLRYTLAQTLARTGHPEEAFALVEPVPAQPHLPVQANYMLGWLLSEYGKGGRRDDITALSYLDKALALDPNHGPSNLAKGKVLLRQGQYAQAQACLERALQNGSDTEEAFRALAEDYTRLQNPHAGDAQRAADAVRASTASLQQARRRYLTNPEDAANILALARLEGNHGNTTEALDLIKQALQKDPNNAAALSLLHSALRPKPAR